MKNMEVTAKIWSIEKGEVTEISIDDVVFIKKPSEKIVRDNLKDIVKKKETSNPGKSVKFNKVNVYPKVAEEIKGLKIDDERKIMKGYFPHLKNSSIDAYIAVHRRYNRYNEETKIDPAVIQCVKTKMVNLWRKGIPITKVNLNKHEEINISSKSLSETIAVLVKKGEVRWNGKSFDVIFDTK